MVLPRTRHCPNVSLPLQPVQEQQQQEPLNEHYHHAKSDSIAANVHNKPPPPSSSTTSKDHSTNNSTNKSTNQQQNSLVVEPVSALNLLQRSRQDASNRLSLLLAPRNHITPSLFPLALGITELYGAAGSGKTQIGLSTCVSCVSFSTTKTALYVSLGEGSTQARIAQRLYQMASSRCSTNNNTTATTLVNDMLQRILTRFLTNQDECLDFITEKLPNMLSKQNDIGILVLDSIAGMFRIDNVSYKQRSLILFQIASQLKRLSDLYKIPILVLNQVSTNISTNTTIPALGLSWASCVNTSYKVERSETEKNTTTASNNQQQQQAAAVFARRITCMKSSSQQQVSLPFTIQASGVVAILE